MFKQIKKSNIYTKKIESNYSYDRLKAINFAYGIVEFDMNAVITSVNDFFAGIFGYKCEELIGKSHSVLLSPAQIEGHNVWWGEIVSGAIVSGEFCRLNKYGEDVWIQASYTRITDKDGVFLGVIKIATDITNRKKLESEYQSLLRAIDRSLGVIEFALNGEIIAFNSIYQELTGYQRDELLGQHHSVLCYPEYVMSKAYLDFWVQLSRGESISGRFSRVNKSGHAFWIHATYSPILSPDGEILRIIKYAHDITEQVEAEATVSKQKDLLDLILMLDRLFIKRCDLNILYNLMFDRLFSIAKCELGLIVLTNKSNDGYSAYARSNDMKIWQGIITGVDNKESQGQCGRGKKINIFNEVLIKNKVVFSNEIIDWTDCRQFSREFPIFECFVGMPINHDGNVIGMLALANKIGGFNEGIVTFLEPLLSTLSTFIYAIKLEVERQRIESILRFDSEHDALTFLPNRNFFFSRTSELIKLIKQERQKIDNCCLAMIDIDYFKKINDAFGHLAGDAVLKDLAKIFVRSLRRNDIVARIGGEEFVILLRDVTPDIAYETMERIRKVVEHYTFNYQSSHFKVTISIGLAEYSFRYENVDQWISIADEKLYEAKRLGRNKSVQ